MVAAESSHSSLKHPLTSAPSDALASDDAKSAGVT